MSTTVPFSVLQSETGARTAIGHDFGSMFEELAGRGEADVAIVSTEEGFSPLGGSRNFFERDLGIPYDEEIRSLARWNQDVNEEVTLIALVSRNPRSLLKGIILAPGENCRSYSKYASPYGRKPHRDYYYNISYEAISYACLEWGARNLAISHLSASGRFHEDMATCHAEALAHFCDAHPEDAPTSFTFCGCCIQEDHLNGIKRLNAERQAARHRPIQITREVVGQAVKLHVAWQIQGGVVSGVSHC